MSTERQICEHWTAPKHLRYRNTIFVPAIVLISDAELWWVHIAYCTSLTTAAEMHPAAGVQVLLLSLNSSRAQCTHSWKDWINNSYRNRKKDLKNTEKHHCIKNGIRDACRFKVGWCVCWTFSTLVCYHRKLSMVFKVTITIEWNGWGQPLGSMVFRWFCGKTTIGNDGFRWLCTIGPTMEWLCTIVEV